MTTIPLKFLFILLHLTFFLKPVECSCILTLKVSVVQTPNDRSKTKLELRSYYHVQRLSDEENETDESYIILFDEANISDEKEKIELPTNKGSNCQGSGDTKYEHIIWDIKDHLLQNCSGEFEIKANGMKKNQKGVDDKLFDIMETFQCDGKEFTKRECSGGGGGEVKLTCTNEYHINVLVPQFKERLQKALDNGDYNNLYKDYQELLQNLGQAGMNYENETASCQEENNWTKYESCVVFFFQPIIAVVASYRKFPIDDQDKIEEWIQPEYISSQWSSNEERVKQMTTLLMVALSKDQVDSGLFTREMIYTILHRGNPGVFPWDKSPFSKYTQQWYEDTKFGNDAELRRIFTLEVDERVRAFCKTEETRSPLCSFMAAKNKYERTLTYLPNHSGVVSVSAYYAEDGLYSSFKNDLETFFQTADIKEQVNKLGTKLGEYFQTLARFDNEIAKVDVGFIKSTLEKNEDRLATNTARMDAIMKDIKDNQKKCVILNMLESVVKIAMAIVTTVGTGGAAAPTAFHSIADAVKVVKQVVAAVKETGAINDIMDSLKYKAEFNAKTTGVDNAISNINNKFLENKQVIDDMHKIQQAVLDGGSFSSTELHVKRFLDSYTNYTPVITKADLEKFNDTYTQMLKTFSNGVENGAISCKFFKDADIQQKLAEAKQLWPSINSLLSHIQEQQYQMIDALVKVVRSKLDESAAKRLEPDLTYYSYNFEILVRHQLAVRVAAQQYCDTFQFLNNDAQNPVCKAMGKNVFLDAATRRKIEAGDSTLQSVLKNYQTNTLFPFIAVTASNDSNNHVINWDKLIDGEVVEFELPINDSQLVSRYGWNTYEDKDALLQSMEIFIPNNLLGNANNESLNVRFKITALQENVVINLKKNAQRYTIKSEHPLSTMSAYSTNNNHCGGDLKGNLFFNDGTQYCLPKDTGRFANNLMLSPPVSLYSKFQIRLINGYEGSRQALKELRPVDDTLTLRARIKVYSNPAAGMARKHLPDIQPMNEPCGPGEYRKIVDTNRQECVPCPHGSVPVAHGTYCVNEAAARKLVGMGIRI